MIYGLAVNLPSTDPVFIKIHLKQVLKINYIKNFQRTFLLILLYSKFKSPYNKIEKRSAKPYDISSAKTED